MGMSYKIEFLLLGRHIYNRNQTRNRRTNVPKEKRDVTLKVGEQVTLRSGFATKSAIVYGGMPDRETYSLVFGYTNGYNSMAYNLYYPSSRRGVVLAKRQLEILSVSPDELRLNILDPPVH
jgi:hypothetical protein